MLVSPIGVVGRGIRGAIGATTMLGRIGAQAIAGAAEGSLFGAGSTVSDAMLGDAELTADKLIAGTGLGAILGLAGGGVGAAIGEGAKAARPALGRLLSKTPDILDDVANFATLKAFRATKAELARFSPAQVENAVRVVRERGHLKLSPEAMAEALAPDIKTTGAIKGGFLDAAEAAGTKPTYSEALRALDDWHASKSPLEQKAIGGAYREARDALQETASRPVSATGEEGSGWRAFDKWKQGLQARAKYQGVSTDDSLTGGLKRELAGVAREELDRQLVPALGTEGQKFLETKALYGALKDANRLAALGSKRPGGFSLSDIIAGGVAAIHHPAGLGTALAMKFMREHGAAIVAKVADRLSESPALEAVAQSMATAVPTLAPKLGPYGGVLTQAFAHSPLTGLATHMVMAQVDDGYQKTTEVAGLTPERPDEHAAVLGRAGALAAVAEAVKAHDALMTAAVDRAIRGEGRAPAQRVMDHQDFGAQRMRREDSAAHDRRVEEVRQLDANPDELLERIAKNLEQLGPVAPGVASALSARAHAAVRYLAQSAAVPARPGMLAHQWAPTQAERHAYSQRLEVVERPMSVMRHTAAGTLTEQHVETLKAVYPALWRSMADKSLERLSERRYVPYRSRLALSLLTGMDLDGTLSPASIASNQAAMRGKSQKPDEAKPAGRSEQTLAQRLALPQQRRAMEA